MVIRKVIPLNWYVLCTLENQDILTAWKIKQGEGFFKNPAHEFYCVTKNGSGDDKSVLKTKRELISFEEFKKHILNIEVIKEW